MITSDKHTPNCNYAAVLHGGEHNDHLSQTGHHYNRHRANSTQNYRRLLLPILLTGVRPCIRLEMCSHGRKRKVALESYHGWVIVGQERINGYGSVGVVAVVWMASRC